VILIEVHHGSLCAGSVLHARVDTAGELCGMHLPAATNGLHGVMLGHLKPQTSVPENQKPGVPQPRRPMAIPAGMPGTGLVHREQLLCRAQWPGARCCRHGLFVRRLASRLQPARTSEPVCSSRRLMVACWSCDYSC